jgi:hypothetical protein
MSQANDVGKKLLMQGQMGDLSLIWYFLDILIH